MGKTWRKVELTGGLEAISGPFFGRLRHVRDYHLNVPTSLSNPKASIFLSKPHCRPKRSAQSLPTTKMITYSLFCRFWRCFSITFQPSFVIARKPPERHNWRRKTEASQQLARTFLGFGTEPPCPTCIPHFRLQVLTEFHYRLYHYCRKLPTKVHNTHYSPLSPLSPSFGWPEPPPTTSLPWFILSLELPYIVGYIAMLTGRPMEHSRLSNECSTGYERMWECYNGHFRQAHVRGSWKMIPFSSTFLHLFSMFS